MYTEGNNLVKSKKKKRYTYDAAGGGHMAVGRPWRRTKGMKAKCKRGDL